MPDYKVCVWGREICSIFVVKEEKQFSDTTSNGGRVGSKTRRNTMILFEVTVCDLRMSTQIVNLKSQIATSKMDWRIRWQKIIVN